MAEEKVTKKMTLGETVIKHPKSAEVMMSYGLHCIGCHVAAYETIEEGAKGHGMSDKQIDEMVEKINKAVEAKKK